MAGRITRLEFYMTRVIFINDKTWTVVTVPISIKEMREKVSKSRDNRETQAQYMAMVNWIEDVRAELVKAQDIKFSQLRADYIAKILP